METRLDKDINQWPDAVDFKIIMESFFMKSSNVAEKTLNLILRALGIENNDRIFGDSKTSNARLNFYPTNDPLSINEKAQVNKLGDMALHHHTDPGILTLLLQDMTGGLQEQVTDGKNWFGWGIQPASKAIIGSLQVPYIYEDRISQKDFTDTLKKALKITPARYEKMSKLGIEHVKNHYSFQKFTTSWINLMDEIIEKHGAWEDRKLYKRWHLLEVA